MRFCAIVFCLLLGIAGCSRDYYVRDADHEVYAALAERNAQSWQVPDLSIDPKPESRLYDPYSLVKPPRPVDDDAAHEYMLAANGIKGYHGWDKQGIIEPLVFNDTWLQALDREADGSVLLNAEKAVLLGIVHGTSYQTELENVYLTALALTLNRFEFACQWYLLNSTLYNHFGASSFPTESNTLTPTTSFGFTNALASGGQLLVDLTNSFIFEYTGKNTYSVSTNLSASLIKPLLRNGGRDVRMEGLTQGERSLLYAIRDFARFRKQFYFNITTRDGGYLGLLLQLQNIRNQEENVRRLEQIYQLHVFLNRSGSISPVQVDQIFLSLKQTQAVLYQSRTSLENSLDGYKFQLGLPPTLPVKLDDAVLNPFQLNTEEVNKLQVELNQLDLKLRQPDQPPPLNELKEWATTLRGYLDRTEKVEKEITSELQHRLKSLPVDSKDVDEQQARLDLSTLIERLKESDAELIKLRKDLASNEKELDEKERQRDWERIGHRTRELITIHADLLVYQTQVRVYGVALIPFTYSEEDAIQLAMTNRLDLMNDQARVVDAWRKISVAANALEPGLSVVGGANLGIEPLATNPFDFSALASNYRVGLQLDGPLNRQIERNTFRATLIQYHRQRRSYQNRADQVVQSLRRNLRQLETDRLNFEIARQSLIAAARQVEASRGRLLLGSDANPATGTLDTLSALSSLLQAKNTLIANWVNYETGRLQLLLDMEILQLDERGIYDEPTFITPSRPRINQSRGP